MVFPVQNNATCMDMINSYECVCSINLIWCSLCRIMPHAWTWSTATSVSASAGSGQPIQLVLLYTKEYTYITRRRDSNIPSSFNNLTHPTSPRLLCWQLYRRTGSAVYCRQRGERLGELTFCKTMGVAVCSKSGIYSFMWIHYVRYNLLFLFSLYTYKYKQDNFSHALIKCRGFSEEHCYQ